ncbi:hypothetical protein LB506_006748, partial [Fusarium annulatum]
SLLLRVHDLGTSTKDLRCLLHPFSSSISPISSLVSSHPLFVFFIFFSQTSFNAPHTFNLFCTPSCTLSWLIYLLSLHLSLGTPEFVIIGFFQPALSINCLIIIQALEPDFHTSTDYSHLALLFAADLLLVSNIPFHLQA